MTIKELRAATNLTQKAFAELTGIPQRTIENWESGRRNPLAYLVELIEYFLKNENYIKTEDMKMTNHGFVKGTNIEIVELNGKRYALNGWNGEKYFDCYEVDECGYAIDPKAAAIEMAPVYAEIGEDEFEITGYTF